MIIDDWSAFCSPACCRNKQRLWTRKMESKSEAGKVMKIAEVACQMRCVCDACTQIRSRLAKKKKRSLDITRKQRKQKGVEVIHPAWFFSCHSPKVFSSVAHTQHHHLLSSSLLTTFQISILSSLEISFFRLKNDKVLSVFIMRILWMMKSWIKNFLNLNYDILISWESGEWWRIEVDLFVEP